MLLIINLLTDEMSIIDTNALLTTISTPGVDDEKVESPDPELRTDKSSYFLQRSEAELTAYHVNLWALIPL